MVRTTIIILALLAPALDLQACTAFTVSHSGHTYIGCNEDAWSINPQVRFEQGRNGKYGGIYFGHFNGHPMRAMVDQFGMNEMGLMYDGLGIQGKEVAPTPGLPAMHFDDLMPLIMHTCATVEEAEAVLHTYDRRYLVHSMIFMADRNGHWLIVESDTLIHGVGPWTAVGNWRMGSCEDPATIPIPRLQDGRRSLQAGTGRTFNEARDVLSSMAVCRKRMGEGTLFSALFDPLNGEAHLFFYHRFDEVVSFNLKQELARGDRTVAMATLFGERPEFERLQAYLTPFHQRWLFWALVALGGCAALVGLVSLFGLGKAIIRPPAGVRSAWLPALITGLIAAITLVLIGFLLFREGVFYFGLGDAAGWLVFLPWTLLLLAVGLAVVHRGSAQRRPAFRMAWLSLLGLFLGSLFYWGMFTG